MILTTIVIHRQYLPPGAKGVGEHIHFKMLKRQCETTSITSSARQDEARRVSSKQRSALDCKLTIAHDDTSIYFDGTARGNNVYVDVGIPISPCKLRIGVAEGHM
jgi:hypothetical protein